MNRRRRAFLVNILMALDALTIVVSFILTYLLRNQLHRFGLETLASFSFYFPFMLWILVIWLFLLRFFRCYSFVQSVGFLSKSADFFKLTAVEIVGIALLAMVLFFTQERMVSRTFLLFFGVINLALLYFEKIGTSLYLRGVRRAKKYHRKVLVVGDRKKVSQFLAVQKDMPELFMDADVNPDFLTQADNPSVGKEWKKLNDDILDYIMDNVVDEVLMVYRDVDLSKMAPLINECRHLGIMTDVVLDTSEIQYPKSEMDKIGPFNIVSFQSYDYSPFQRLLKRIMDVTGGLVGCVIFALAYLFVAPLIKLTSPGPVLFVQTRKGKNGREFRLFKFRTMYADAEERKKEFLAQNEMKGHIFKMTNDPRITPLGKFLRKTSLDELPQFVNILKGDMSLVGTRPPTVGEFESYEKRHRRRLSIQPGLTGLWQVSGRNKISDFEDIVKLDTEYIDNWSIWLDIKIILKTFTVLFRGQ